MDSLRPSSKGMHGLGRGRASKHQLPISLTLEHVSTATQLLEKRKQMNEVQETLETQKKGFANKEELFKRREGNLRKKDLELQEALVLFNRFLKQNEAKKRAADISYEQERKQKIQKGREIMERTRHLDALQKECEDLQLRARRMEKYQGFLTRMYEQYVLDYEDEARIMSRHDQLQTTHNELKAKSAHIRSATDRLRKDVHEDGRRQYNENIELNNAYSTKSEALDAAIEAVGGSEKTLEERQRKEQTRILNTSQILMSIENLYQRCKTSQLKNLRHGSAEVPSTDANAAVDAASAAQSKYESTAHRLRIIGKYVSDFDDIVHGKKRHHH